MIFKNWNVKFMNPFKCVLKTLLWSVSNTTTQNSNFFILLIHTTYRPYVNASGSWFTIFNFVFFIPYVYIIVSLIFIFWIIRTLDYPDYLLKSLQVWIIEVRLYSCIVGFGLVQFMFHPGLQVCTSFKINFLCLQNDASFWKLLSIQ